MKKLAIIFGLLLIVVWFSRWRAPESASFVSSPAVATTSTPSAGDANGTESHATEPLNVSSSMVTDAGASSRFVIDSANQEIIRACLGADRIHFGRGLTLENIVDDLASKREPIEVSMNVHVRRPSGREQRLRVEPSTEQASPSRWVVDGSSVRLFDVDNENLPVAIAFPKELRLDSLDRIIRDFTDGAEITFRERRSHERLSETATADIIETNGHINQLQLIADDASLGCAWQNSQLDCRCL